MESGKIIVVANQKGGVAKTSTVRNLSYALAEMGKKVLVVDFDPQYNLTTSFGVLPTQAPYNTGTLITNLLLDESLPDTNEFIQKIGSVDLIPSSRSLTVAEANLLMTPDSNDYLAKPNYVSSTFGKLLAKNNLRHIRFHDLRHTCASLLLANGVPMEQVKEWLGHSEISTTVDIYGHLQYATKKQSAAAIEQDIVAPMLQNLSAVSP